MPRCGASDLRCIIPAIGTGIGMNHRLYLALFAAIGGLGGLLSGCGTKTDVSVTGNTPAQYSHVWVTVQAVWFNTSGTAGPDDSGWDKFTFSTPSTVDLVAENGGNLGSIASGLRVQVGTYSQVRLIPVDSTAPLASSASNAGALYNFEADYVDSQGMTHQLQLELLNPDKGIGIPTSLKVPIGNFSSTGLTGTGTSTSTTTGALPFASSSSTTSSPFGTTTGSTGTTGLTSTTGSTSTTPDNSFATALDGTVNLVPFTFASSSTGILWSAHATSAYDISIASGISGQLSLTNITTAVSGLPNIQVSAQTLSADGSRHVVVSTSAVQSDGSFLLYPLATNSSTTSPLTYDVVIHGPGIATIIVKSVQVPRPTTSSNTTTTSSTTTLATANTTVSSPSLTTTTTSPTTNSNVSSVSLGTLTPRASAASGDPTSYNANVSTAPGALLPAGAVVNFYQTLGGQGEVPYVIESNPMDPFNQVLFNAQALSVGTVDSGTWSTNGTVTIVSAAPKEGVGAYLVAASAPGFSDGTLSKSVSVSQPTSGGTAMVVLPALTLESGASAGSLAAAVVAATPGKYDQGQLLLSHDGALVASAPLDAVLSQGTGGIVTVPGLPAGTPDAVYYATVRAWKSTDPSGVQRQWYPQAIDLRSSTSGTIALTVN
jgi:Domain of unknown function (DUF4382)